MLFFQMFLKFNQFLIIHVIFNILQSYSCDRKHSLNRQHNNSVKITECLISKQFCSDPQHLHSIFDI